MLAALLLAASWSTALCETSCLLPHGTHSCCAAQAEGSKASMARLPGCPHPGRTIATFPATSPALAPVAAGALELPLLACMAQPELPMQVRTASPPAFNLRI